MFTNFIRINNSKQKPKKCSFVKDLMIVGIISGTLGAAAMELINVLAGKKLWLGKVASTMIIYPIRTISLKNTVLGEIMHLTVGAGIGSIIAALLKRTGKDLLMIKGTFVGLLVWVGLHNLGHRINLFSLKPHSTKYHYLAFIQHIIYGISTSFVIKYLAAPDSFRQAPMIKPNSQTNGYRPRYDQPFWPSEIEPERPESQELQYKYPTA